jgi:phosphoribosyl 1,2-cyclic phosphodiesterase
LQILKKDVFLCKGMALHITSLNSGSNGNCYYIASNDEAVLVDTGISCRETEKRMLGLGLSMKKVKAIFISHEHTDHIKGLPVIAAKYRLPVFITKDTYTRSGLLLPADCLQWLTAKNVVEIGSLRITAFPKEHDAADAHSFVINGSNVTVGVFTDIGVCCSNVSSYFKLCNAAFLESNYDEDMLENGRYPAFLKNRIRGGKGHLSNRQALEIFTSYRPEFMSHLLLSHLSKDNNDPLLVQQLFEAHASQTKIIVASRYEATRLYSISRQQPAVTNHSAIVKARPVQMGLFD